MTYHELTSEFKRLEITHKQFAEMTGLKYMTILNYSRQTSVIPVWIPSYLKLYEKAKKYDTLVSILPTVLQKI
jgi:hypothetical protein